MKTSHKVSNNSGRQNSRRLTPKERDAQRQFFMGLVHKRKQGFTDVEILGILETKGFSQAKALDFLARVDRHIDETKPRQPAKWVVIGGIVISILWVMFKIYQANRG